MIDDIGEDTEVKWYKDDKKLKNKKKPNLRIDYDTTEEVYFLEIANATVEDAGSYTVKVRKINIFQQF